MTAAVTGRNNKTNKCASLHKNKSVIGTQYYCYDLNGSVLTVQNGPYQTAPECGGVVINEADNGACYGEGDISFVLLKCWRTLLTVCWQPVV